MKYSDEELILKIKNGDENAESELLMRYKELVVKICRGYFIVGGDYEDLIQEGMIGLYKAIKSYVPEKEATFKTYAVVCIKHQIHSAIKSANTKKNQPLSSAVSFQDFTQNSSSDNLDFLPVELIFSTTPAEQVSETEEYENLKSDIKKCLSSLEYQILKLYLDGFSYKEMASSLKINTKSIGNSLSRIKQKLRQNLKKAQ